MKKIVLLLIVIFFAACKSEKVNPNEIIITSKKQIIATDYSIKIDKVISDSRCPEGVNCIWAGELVMQLCVHQNNTIKETKIITFSPKTFEENMIWFSQLLPEGKKLKQFKIETPKKDTPMELKDYKIVLILE